MRDLRQKAERFPRLGARRLVLGLWLKRGSRPLTGAEVFTPRQVMRVLR